jgi:hypothetical protein
VPQRPVAAGRATRSARPNHPHLRRPLLWALVAVLVAGLVAVWLPSALLAAPETDGPPPLTADEAFVNFVTLSGMRMREQALLDSLRKRASQSGDATLQRQVRNQELVVRTLERAVTRAGATWERVDRDEADRELAAARQRVAQDPSPENQQALEAAEERVAAADARQQVQP